MNLNKYQHLYQYFNNKESFDKEILKLLNNFQILLENFLDQREREQKLNFLKFDLQTIGKKISQFFCQKDNDKFPFENRKPKGFSKKGSMKNLKSSQHEINSSKEFQFDLKTASIKSLKKSPNNPYKYHNEGKPKNFFHLNQPVSLEEIDDDSK